MTLAAYLTLALLAVLFLLLIKTKIPAPAIFLGALTVAITLKLAPTGELLKGFSNQGMLTVAVLFMVAAGMYATGAITMIMDKLIGLPKSIFSAQVKILPPIAVGSAFLNNTPLVAMMIPVIRDLSRASRLPAQQLYLPLSFASILGGMCTVIGTSTNLVIAGLTMDAIADGAGNIPGLRAIKMFDPALVGIPIAVLGIIFMIVAGRFFLKRKAEDRTADVALRRYTAEFEVREGSRIVGRTLEATGIASGDGVEILYIQRGGRILTNDLMHNAEVTGA